MQADFFDAFQRHWDDAEYLYTISHWPNADQLYAYSAECGLKCMMLQFGMLVNNEGIPQKGLDKVHAEKIWNRYESYRMGRALLGYELPQPNPFDDWEISNRYAHKTNFNHTITDKHKQGAETVKNLIHKAILEGRLVI
jgi:hypothetical protein